MARPSKATEWLTDDKLLVIKGWARDGLTNKEIAHNVGVRADTFSTWVTRYAKLSQALKDGRQPVLVKLEDSMLHKSQGYFVEEVKTEIYEHTDGRTSKKITKTKRWIPEDTTMLIFLAKNKMPNKYSDHPDPVAEELFESSGLMAALMADPDEDLCDDTEAVTDEEES